jgi:H+/Cl- antiporter ClcA
MATLQSKNADIPPTLRSTGAVLGAAAVLAATTHGTISAVVLVMELTGRDQEFKK